MNYLKTKDDHINYIKALCKQMNSDGKIAVREECYIRAKAGFYGIPAELLEETLNTYRGGNVGEIQFSCKEAAAQTCVDALDLTVIDYEFDKSESKSLKALGEELGVPGNEEVTAMLQKYIVTDMAATAGFEEVMSSILSEKKQLDEALPEKKDKLSFIICLAKVICADGEVNDAEHKFGASLASTFGVGSETAAEALRAFMANPDIVPEFTNDFSRLLALREATRAACTDNVLSDVEKDTILALADDLGGDISEETLDKLEEAVEKRFEARKLREEALAKYIEQVQS